MFDNPREVRQFTIHNNTEELEQSKKDSAERRTRASRRAPEKHEEEAPYQPVSEQLKRAMQEQLNQELHA